MLSAEPKTEADNTYRDLHYLGYHKIRIHCFEGNNDKHAVAPNLNDIVVGNHALREQPTDHLSSHWLRAHG